MRLSIPLYLFLRLKAQKISNWDQTKLEWSYDFFPGSAKAFSSFLKVPSTGMTLLSPPPCFCIRAECYCPVHVNKKVITGPDQPPLLPCVVSLTLVPKIRCLMWTVIAKGHSAFFFSLTRVTFLSHYLMWFICIVSHRTLLRKSCFPWLILDKSIFSKEIFWPKKKMFQKCHVLHLTVCAFSTQGRKAPVGHLVCLVFYWVSSLAFSRWSITIDWLNT